ncbi:hypothetical protein F2Q68_00014137 [Brassica cretica]|uniref:Uncharacterized protein n=1 Tax=Brassica cretica TaxID=69181 RepID=A0A8S9HT66_BRACR|nr:hypothetical protein F2Q68_00014137 [Brassica cretica]
MYGDPTSCCFLSHRIRRFVEEERVKEREMRRLSSVNCHYCLLPSPPQSRYHESSDVFKSHSGFVTSSTTKLLCIVYLPVTRTNSKHRERAREIEREREVTSVVTSGGGGDYGEDGDRRRWI